MILPVFAYGQPVLRKVCDEITPEMPDLANLIENMWQTMYNAKGIGLAAPQIGQSVRLFIVDTKQLETLEGQHFKGGIKNVFINAQLLSTTNKNETMEEGCLSIPAISENVERPLQIIIRYFDETFKQHEEMFLGYNARVIQHEYDHIQGVLFTDKVAPLQRRLLKGKLDKISKGNVEVSYAMRFHKRR